MHPKIHLKPFHYGKKLTISDFRKNYTTEVSLFMEFKSCNFLNVLLRFKVIPRENYGFQIIDNSSHKKKYKFVILLLCLKDSSSGTWNFLDTFNHSKII